jgi:hypothetical protein
LIGISYESIIGEHLTTRSYVGLEARFGMDEPSMLELGREGIARGYGDDHPHRDSSVRVEPEGEDVLSRSSESGPSGKSSKDDEGARGVSLIAAANTGDEVVALSLEEEEAEGFESLV